MRAILLAAVLASTLLGAVAAQTLEQQWAWCRDDFSERLIRACTAVIRAERQTPDKLARAFFNRGRAWSDSGQYDRAISDFGQAIRLDPEYPDAFNNRGVAYSGQGQYERAIQDFDQAIRLDPNYAIAIYNRGLAAQSLGRTDEASKYLRECQTGWTSADPVKGMIAGPTVTRLVGAIRSTPGRTGPRRIGSRYQGTVR